MDSQLAFNAAAGPAGTASNWTTSSDRHSPFFEWTARGTIPQAIHHIPIHHIPQTLRMATTTPPEHSYLRLDDLYLRLDDLVSSKSREHSGSEEAAAPVGASGDFVVSAIARHKLLVVLLGFVVAAAGVGIGLVRKPTYTSSATLQVGAVNLNSPSFYGFVQSASDIATVFSRSITAAPVLAELKSKLGLSPTEATQRLSAEPIPISPSFRVIATGSTAHAAINLANTASNAVIAYETHSASITSPQTEALLKDYISAAQALERSSASAARLAQTRHRSGAGEDPALIQARSEADAAHLHLSALGTAYQSALVNAGVNPSSGLVSLVAGAAIANSDRSSKIELLAFVGLLAGLVAGAVAASLYERRRLRRSVN